MLYGSERRIRAAQRLGNPRPLGAYVGVRVRIPLDRGLGKRKSTGLSTDALWQREKDSNPHKQSQSLLCYPYTISLSADIIIHDPSEKSIGFFLFFEKSF